MALKWPIPAVFAHFARLDQSIPHGSIGAAHPLANAEDGQIATGERWCAELVLGLAFDDCVPHRPREDSTPSVIKMN